MADERGLRARLEEAERRAAQSEGELAEARRELAAERERTRAVLDALPIGVAIASVPDGAIAFVNDTGSQLLRDEVNVHDAGSYATLGAQHPDGRRYRPEDYPLARSAIAGEEIRGEPLIYRRGDGAVVELEVDASRIGTSPPLAVATFLDVTERNRAQAAERASEARLERTLDASADGIFVLDRDWRFAYLNAAARAMIAQGRDLQGQSIWEAFPEAAGGPLHEAYRRAVAGGQPTRTVHDYGTRDRLFEARAYPDAAGLTVYLRDITEQQAADDSRQLLVRELHHRVKNLFAVMSGMVGMTARATRTPAEMAVALRTRIAALATAHELIRPAVTQEDADHHRPTVQALVMAILAPHLRHETDVLDLSGPTTTLGANGATSLSLAIHELATNAAKYGALSVPGGTLSVHWGVENGRLLLSWSERGGPRVEHPPRIAGFGSTLMEMSVRQQLGGTIAFDWTPAGLDVRIDASLDRIGA